MRENVKREDEERSKTKKKMWGDDEEKGTRHIKGFLLHMLTSQFMNLIYHEENRRN